MMNIILIINIIFLWITCYSIAQSAPCQWRFPGEKKIPLEQNHSALNDIAFGDGVYVIAGDGFLLRSEDAEKWHRIPFAEELEFTSVVAGKGQFVVGGKAIVRSKDGLNWTDNAFVELQRRLLHCPTPHLSIASLAWNGKRYVGLGSGATLLSDDGELWTSMRHRVAGPIRVQWVNGFFIGLHRFGAIQSVDGEHWTPLSLGGVDEFAGIATNGNVTVITTALGFIYTSTNGADWNSFALNEHFPSTTGANLNLWDIAWNGERFVAVGFEGLVLVSEDGLQWRVQVQPMKIMVQNRHVFVVIRWLNGRFMALDSYAGLHTSVDGLTWTSSRPTGIACPQCAVLSCDDL